MPDLAIRLGSKEFDLAKLLSGLGLPDDISSKVTTILADPAGSLDMIRDELQDHLPEKYQFLLGTVDELGVHELDLIDVAETRTPTSAIGLTLSGSAALRMRKLDTASATLVAFGAIGNVESGVAAKAAAGIMTVGLNAKAHVGRTIEFGIDPAGDDLVLATLTDLPGVLVDPSDIAAVAAKMQSSGLRRLARSGTANNTIGIAVGINQALSEAMSGIGINISGKAGASLSLQYQDDADFTLSVESSGNGYQIDLSKNRKTRTSSILQLGVDVQLVGLREGLLDSVTAALPNAAEVRELLQKLDEQVHLLSEGTLRAELSGALSERWEGAAPLFEMLLGEQPVAEFATRIQQELQGRIDDIVSSNVDLLNDKSTKAAQSVLGALALELNLTGDQKAKLDGYLEAALEQGVEKLQRAFAKADIARKILPRGKVGTLLGPLQGVGKAVDNVLKTATSAQPPAQELIAALRAVYKRYSNFRRTVVGMVKNDLEEKFALTVISEKSRVETSSHTLLLRVPAAEITAPEIAELYRNLWNGDLRTITSMLGALPPTVHVQGEYVRTVKRVEKMAISLNMFGLGISSKTMFSDNVKVGFDHSHKLVAATSDAEIARQFSSLFFWSKESQTVLASWDIDYLSRTLLDNPVSIKLSVLDDNFKSKGEVDDFFEPLEKGGLVRSGLADEVQQALFQDNNKSLKDVQISLSVPVSWNGWKLLLESAPPRTLLSAYLQKVVLLDPDELDEAHRYLHKAGRSDLLDFLLELGSQTRTDAAANQGVFPSTKPPPKFLMAYYFGRTMHQLQAAISASREAWLKVNEVVSEPSSSGREIEQAMADFNDEFSRNFRGLMVRAGIDNRGAVNWRSAALLGFFRSLDASTDKPNPYLPCSFKAADREALIFS